MANGSRDRQKHPARVWVWTRDACIPPRGTPRVIGPTSHYSPALMQPSAQRETRKQNGPGSPRRPRSLHLTPLPSTRARPLLGGSGPGRPEARGPTGARGRGPRSASAPSVFSSLLYPEESALGSGQLPVLRREGPLHLRGLERWKGRGRRIRF